MATYKSNSTVRKSYKARKPTVETSAVSLITSTTATGTGIVVSEGTQPTTERGICYGPSTSPNTSGTKVVAGSGLGTFTGSITGLTANTQYYIRAYAINSIGTSYGASVAFTTVASDLPVVTTAAISAITPTSASGGGNVISAGSSSVTTKGICYSTSPNPTTANSIVASGSGTGSFTSGLSALSVFTTYYVRAYATNSSGTSYGAQVTFKTAADTAIPFFTYIDGMEEIIVSPTLTTNLRNFQVTKKINIPIYYMGSLLSDSGNRTAMRSLLTANTTVGIVKNGVNVTQSDAAVNTSNPASKASYNIGCATAAEKFTHFFEEIEFYKANPYVDSFAEYQTQCNTIKAWTSANGVAFNVYYARCRDVAGVATPEEIADYLVATFDTLMLVNYVTPTKFATYGGFSPSIKTEFGLIADAAKRTGKVQKMQMIFAANGNAGDNMRDYFIANPTLLPAYNSAKSTYNAWTFTNKSSLDFQGMTIYAYSGISDL